MNGIRTKLLFILCVLALASPARAANTPAGTAIVVTTTVMFDANGLSQTPVTGSTSFLVDRKVNLVVTRTADAAVASGAANQAVSFLVSNLGNTPQRFALSVVSRGTDSFDMNNVRIYRDAGTQSGVWDAGDTLYADAATFGDVASAASLTVLIVADTPLGRTNGETAVYDLLAASVDAGTTNLTIPSAGPNTAGIEVVFADPAGTATGDGAREGRHSAAGSFTVSDVNVLINKTVTVLDQFGGSLPVPGATLRYTIQVSTSGGTATGVVITDPLPLNTTYVPGSLRLNASVLSDAVDGDAGELAGFPDTVTVRLGTLTGASPQQTIVFDVRIN